MTIMQEALAMKGLVAKGMKQVDITKVFNVHKSEVTRRMKMLSLSNTLQAAIDAGQMSADAAIQLHQLTSSNAKREAIYEEAVQIQKCTDERNASSHPDERKRGRQQGATHSKKQAISTKAILEAAKKLDLAGPLETQRLAAPLSGTPLYLEHVAVRILRRVNKAIERDAELYRGKWGVKGKRISCAELSRRTAIPRTTLGCYLDGSYTLSIDIADRLMRALGWTLADILGPSEHHNL